MKTVKCRLNKLVTYDPEEPGAKIAIVDYIEGAVVKVNMIRMEMYNFLNFHIIRLIHKSPSPPLP